MWPLLGKTVIVIAVPLVIDAIVDLVSGALNKDQVKEENPVWTQFEVDYICFGFRQYISHNRAHPKSRITHDQLVDRFNEVMGRQESGGAYDDVWLGNVDRDCLESGEHNFTYEDIQ